MVEQQKDTVRKRYCGYNYSSGDTACLVLGERDGRRNPCNGPPIRAVNMRILWAPLYVRNTYVQAYKRGYTTKCFPQTNTNNEPLDPCFSPDSAACRNWLNRDPRIQEDSMRRYRMTEALWAR